MKDVIYKVVEQIRFLRGVLNKVRYFKEINMFGVGKINIKETINELNEMERILVEEWPDEYMEMECDMVEKMFGLISWSCASIGSVIVNKFIKSQEKENAK